MKFHGRQKAAWSRLVRTGQLDHQQIGRQEPPNGWKEERPGLTAVDEYLTARAMRGSYGSDWSSGTSRTTFHVGLKNPKTQEDAMVPIRILG